MWWLADPQDLHRIEDRLSTCYVERCHVERDGNAVCLVNREQTVRLPAAMVACLLLGPGTRITHAAMVLLADSGTAVCWVGDRGVRMYASGLGVSRGAALLHRQAWLVTRPTQRISVARQMYDMRFPGEDTSSLTMQQLRGREGARIKKLYRQQSLRTGVPWARREYRPGDALAAGDDVNRLLSAGNAALYGLCHAVIVGIGASPALGFVHTGGAISFVLDIADLYKADYTIPAAFDLAAARLTSERDARIALRDRISQGQLIGRIISDIKALLTDGEEQPDVDEHLLFDDQGTVPGGINWASQMTDDWDDETSFIGVSGPELATEQEPP